MRIHIPLNKFFVAACFLFLGLAIAGCQPPTTISTETPKNEKTIIRDKMSSANKNYQTVKGQYSYRYDMVASDFEFQIRQGDKPASYVVNHDLRTKSKSYSIYDGTYILTTWDFLRDPSVRYPMYSWEFEELEKTVAFPFNYQDMPHPHKLANGLLSKEDTWAIERKEVFLGRAAYVILAGRDPNFGTQFEKTRLWVDEQTGLLLKKEYISADGNSFIQVEMTALEVDGQLDEQKFAIPPDLIAQLHLPPEQEEKEREQVRSALKAFYDRRSKQDYGDEVVDYTITAIERKESAVMQVHVTEKIVDGTSRENARDIYKKNGQWREYSP